MFVSIPEHMGPYVIDMEGTVWRVDKNGNPKKKPNKPWRNADNYIYIGLSPGGGKKIIQMRIGILMMMSWKPEEYYEGSSLGKTVDHINRDNEDNRLENLQMATEHQQKRNRDMTNHGKGQRYPIDELDLDGNLIMVHESQTDAAKTRTLQQAMISKCLRGSKIPYGGSLWRWHVKSTDGNLPGEIWIGENRDFVSSHGRFKKQMTNGSFHNVITPAGMYKKNSYPFISFGGRYMYFHHVVCKIFSIRKPDGWNDSWIINHKDGNKENAAVSNLEWMTRGDNNRHALEVGLRIPFTRPVRQLDLEGNIIAEFVSVNAAADSETRFHAGLISKCINNNGESHAGYLWIAVDDCK